MNCEAIANSISIPVIADGDTGYGGIFNVARLVRDLEKVGVAGVHLEDQELPKRCGHLSGKHLVPMKEHAALIKAAADARRNPDFLIIARIDALAVTGFEDAVKRARCYLESGADVAFFDGINGMEELIALPKAMPAGTILMANLMEGGKTPFVAADNLEEMGYAMVIWPGSLIGAAVYAIRKVLNVLREKGTTESIISEIVPLGELFRLGGWEEVEAFIARYAYDLPPK
jgi:methylisocitrate lyase